MLLTTCSTERMGKGCEYVVSKILSNLKKKNAILIIIIKLN